MLQSKHRSSRPITPHHFRQRNLRGVYTIPYEEKTPRHVCAHCKFLIVQISPGK